MGKEKASDNGFIMLHRKITEWEWYTNANTAHLFIYCLLRANHKTQKWQGTTIERGAFITSLSNLAAETGMSLKAIRTALNHLESTGEIKRESTNKYTKIIVINYNNYQKPDKQTARNRHATDTPSDKQRANKGQQTIMNNNENKVYPPAPPGAEGDIQNKAALPAAPLVGAPSAAEKPKTREVREWFEEHGYNAYCAGDFISESWTLNPKPDYSDWKNRALKYAEQWTKEKENGER